MDTMRRWRFLSKVAIVAAMAGLLLGSSLLAVNPHLHSLLHHSDEAGTDSSPASSANHQCAATLLAKGALDIPTPTVLGLSFAHVPLLPAASDEEYFALAVPYRLLPERAPPVS